MARKVSIEIDDTADARKGPIRVEPGPTRQVPHQLPRRAVLNERPPLPFPDAVLWDEV
jgi:hypothetical protein